MTIQQAGKDLIQVLSQQQQVLKNLEAAQKQQVSLTAAIPAAQKAFLDAAEGKDGMWSLAGFVITVKAGAVTVAPPSNDIASL